MIFEFFKIRMLLSIVQLSLKSIHSTKLLKTVNLRTAIRCEYSTRWVSRKPVAIVNKHELFDTGTTKADEQRIPKTHRERSRVSTCENEEKTKKQKEIENKGNTVTEPKYIALNADDKLIRYIIFQVITQPENLENIAL